MKYTLGTAAKATGKSKATIHRAVKSGKLSAFRCDNGSYEIEPAELHRVYPPVSSNGFEELSMRQSETPEETALLRQENDFLKQQLEREKEFSRELSSRLDDETADRRRAAEEIKRLTLLITHQPEPPAKKSKLLEKLFGKTNK